MKHSIVMNATKTRSRYVSLAAVLSDQNTVAKDWPIPVSSYAFGHCAQSNIRFLGVPQLPKNTYEKKEEK